MARVLEFPRIAELPTIEASAFSQPHFAQLLARTRRIIHQASSSVHATRPDVRDSSNVVSIGEVRRFEFPIRANAS